VAAGVLADRSPHALAEGLHDGVVTGGVDRTGHES
jgi:hypothetical protein